MPKFKAFENFCELFNANLVLLVLLSTPIAGDQLEHEEPRSICSANSLIVLESGNSIDNLSDCNQREKLIKLINPRKFL